MGEIWLLYILKTIGFEQISVDWSVSKNVALHEFHYRLFDGRNGRFDSCFKRFESDVQIVKTVNNNLLKQLEKMKSNVFIYYSFLVFRISVMYLAIFWQCPFLHALLMMFLICCLIASFICLVLLFCCIIVFSWCSDDHVC